MNVLFGVIIGPKRGGVPPFLREHDCALAGVKRISVKVKSHLLHLSALVQTKPNPKPASERVNNLLTSRSKTHTNYIRALPGTESGYCLHVWLWFSGDDLQKRVP